MGRLDGERGGEGWIVAGKGCFIHTLTKKMRESERKERKEKEKREEKKEK